MKSLSDSIISLTMAIIKFSIYLNIKHSLNINDCGCKKKLNVKNKEILVVTLKWLNQKKKKKKKK